MTDKIDIEAVYSMAKTFLTGTQCTDELLFKMSVLAAVKIDIHLKENVDKTAEEVIYIAAAYALYRYAAITGFTQEEYESIRTGDIDYKTSSPEFYEKARRMLVDAVKSNSNILKDAEFLFSCV